MLFRSFVDDQAARYGDHRDLHNSEHSFPTRRSSDLVEDPETFGLLRRNAGTIRSMFDEPTVGAGVEELREDLAAGIRSGLLPEHDVEYMASAMVGAGFEVAVRMLERTPPDVDGAVEFVTRIFLAGLGA